MPCIACGCPCGNLWRFGVLIVHSQEFYSVERHLQICVSSEYVTAISQRQVALMISELAKKYHFHSRELVTVMASGFYTFGLDEFNLILIDQDRTLKIWLSNNF